MPKVKLSKWQDKRKMFEKNLNHLKGGSTNEEMGFVIGVSGVTFGNRLKNPGEIKLKELFLLCDFCKVDMGRFVSEELKW